MTDQHQTCGVILLGHGSRDPLWRAPMEAVAEKIAVRSPRTAILCAYLEISEPSLQQAVAAMTIRGIGQISILPLFLGAGKHVREDIPELVTSLLLSNPGLQISLKKTVGEDQRVLELLSAIALEEVKI